MVWRTIGVWIICTIAGMGSVWGQSSAERPTDATAAKTLRVGLLPKLIGIEYFNAAEIGAREAARELGVELIYDGPTTNDSARQSQMISEWIARRVDVICVAPNDPDSIAPVLRKARARGVRVLTWDADANPERSQREFFVNQAENEAIGRSLVDVLAAQMGNQGEYAIITGSLTAANQNIWMEWMRKQVQEKYPGLKEVALKASEEDQQLAFRVTQDVLKAYPSLGGIFGITTVSLPGAAEAVERAGKSGQVKVTGLGLPSTTRKYVHSGTIETFILWNPIDLGYLTIHAAKLLHEDRIKADSTIECGRLGTIQVKGDQILLGPPMRFTRENVDQFAF